MVEIVLDSNALFRLYGAYSPKKRIRNFEAYAKHALLLELVDQNKLKLHITPQIYSEFLNLKKKKLRSSKRFFRFINEYIERNPFTDAEYREIAQIVKMLATQEFDVPNEDSTETHKEILFPNADQGQVNHSDLKIMVQSAKINKCVITENIKDFIGYKHINLALSQFGMEYTGSVMTLEAFYQTYFPEEYKKLQQRTQIMKHQYEQQTKLQKDFKQGKIIPLHKYKLADKDHSM